MMKLRSSDQILNPLPYVDEASGLADTGDESSGTVGV